MSRNERSFAHGCASTVSSADRRRQHIECSCSPHSGQMKPDGHRARSSAASHLASVPTCSMNSLSDMPCWNWIGFWGIARSPCVGTASSVCPSGSQPASPPAELQS